MLFENVAIISKPQFSKSCLDLIKSLVPFLTNTLLCRSVCMDEQTYEHYSVVDVECQTWNFMRANCTLAIVVGGDGTMIGTMRRFAGSEVPVIGINNGNLGFTTDIEAGNYEQDLMKIWKAQFIQGERSLLEASIFPRGQQETRTFCAVNDVVINRGATSGLLHVAVHVDGMHLTDYKADGLIISTPTGSTAYSLSVGGPIVLPTAHCLVIAPIAPHTLSCRPIVISQESKIEILLKGGKDVAVNFDSHSISPVCHGDAVTIKRSDKVVRLIHPEDWNYFEILRKKLRWND